MRLKVIEVVIDAVLIMIVVWLGLTVYSAAKQPVASTEAYYEVCAKLYGDLPASDYHVVCGSKGK